MAGAHLLELSPLLGELSSLCIQRIRAVMQLLPLVHAFLLSLHKAAFS